MRYYSTMKTFFVDCYTTNVEQSKKMDKFLSFLDKTGVCDLIREEIEKKNKNEEKGGRPTYNFYNLFAAIVYNFAFGKGTLRDIEDRIKNDIRCIYIMQNEYPSYKSIGNFINDFILPNQDEIFSKITKTIFEECELKMDNMYIDESKFEANANKYKFVWKPTTFHKKLSDKIKIILKEYKIDRGIQNEGIIETKEIANKLIELNEKLKIYDLNLKENKKHKDNYELLTSYLEEFRI